MNGATDDDGEVAVSEIGSNVLPNHTESSWTIPTSTVEDDPLGNGFVDTTIYDQQITAQSLGLDHRFVPLTTANDLEWLFDGTFQSGREVDCGSDLPYLDQDYAQLLSNALDDTLPIDMPSQKVPTTTHPPATHNVPQRCKWRVCNAMTEARRLELLLTMRDEFDTKALTSDIFSLHNLAAGVHFYSKYVSSEYNFHHPRILFPEEDEKVYLQEYYGDEAPYQLAWAIITLGWMLLEQEEPNVELIEVSRVIQRAIRVSIMTTIATSSSPALWVLQTLFLVLLFARYHGDTNESGTAPILHGVLVNLVRRLDLSNISDNLDTIDQDTLGYEHWYRWIKTESLKRMVFQTFILDVQQTLLFGGNSSMSPFEINLDLPWGVPAWTADTLADWRISMRDSPHKPPLFLSMLKQFWNLPSSGGRSIHIAANPGDARVILHGVVSIASETWRRHRDAFTSKPSDDVHSLSARIISSFENWMIWWNGDAKRFYVEKFNWRTCPCFYRLAHTLCELGSADLQIAAGATEIEGRRIRPDDFAKAKRRAASWAATEAASVAVSEAARVVQSRLETTTDPHYHCHHCNRSLYIAGLVLWNFTFAKRDTTPYVDQVPTYSDVDSTLAQLVNIGHVPYIQHENVFFDITAVMRSIAVLLGKDPSGIIEEARSVLGRLASSAI